MIPFLLVIVVIVVVGASVLAYRNRPESSIESGIRSFRREMRALAPPPERPSRADIERGAGRGDAETEPPGAADHEPPNPGPG